MENKQNYHAPLAELVMLAPMEEISSSFGKNNSWWMDNSAWWGVKYSGTGSVITAGLGISDEDGNSWTYDSK